MSTATDIVRANRFAQVLEYRLEHPGSTIAEACKATDVAERTFYDWMAADNEAMDVVKDALNAAQRTSLFEYSQRIYTALKMLLDEATSSGVKPETRLKILRFVMPLFDDYAKVHHATPGGEDRAPFLRSGPVLETGQSRFDTLNITVQGTVSIEAPTSTPVPQIIEGQFEELK